MPKVHFEDAFEELTGHPPFPWQQRLYDKHFGRGMLPPAVDIPTGLGKTAIMAVWLLARAAGAPLPRRLVYVVDRRAVVDQATEFAGQLRERLGEDERLGPVRSALGLGSKRLPISTLRGRHADNREWMADPAAPAIVVGTVDMVGSRLLFEGYGLSRRMRPFAAALLGCDALVLLDEAHLVRPFERLLKTIEKGRRRAFAQEADAQAGAFAGPAVHDGLPPPFHVLPLSATLGRESDGNLFRLNDDDRKNGTVRARLEARKRLTVEDLPPGLNLNQALVDRAWNLMEAACANAGQPPAVAVYCDRRTDAGKVADDLRKRASQERPQSEVILLVGGRRVRERHKAAEKLQEHGLVGEAKDLRRTPVFLVATSAGEVGVDLDADHMVCDLVSWERMVQRLGRVNRRGTGDAMVRVIDQGKPDEKKAGALAVARHEAARSLLDALPLGEAGERPTGPGVLENLAADPAQHARIAEATTRMPLYPALTRPLIDSWAMTALEHHAGRPEIGPWLRGWVEDNEPQTAVVWRHHLPLHFRTDGGAVQAQAEQAVRAFFAAAPPQAAELLETETSRVVDWLKKRVRKQLKELDRAAARAIEPYPAPVGDSANDEEETARGTRLLAPLTRSGPIAFLVDAANRPADALSLAKIDRIQSQNLKALLAGKRLVVDARFGGIRNGLLDDTANDCACTIEDNWGKPGDDGDDPEENPWNLKVEVCSEDAHNSDGWQAVLEAPYCVSAEGETWSRLIISKRRGTGESEDARAMARKAQRLDEHQEWAEKEAARIADALDLPEADRAMLTAAARHHDDGKTAKRWQEAFNAPQDWHDGGPYAKTTGPFNRQRLNGYRHEFKSVLDAERVGLDGLDRGDPRFELALHLIAAHHGRARPGIGIEGYDEEPPSAAEQAARAIALRFARLQREWGPWGLAWWEALLRAADQAASRRLDDGEGDA